MVPLKPAYYTDCNRQYGFFLDKQRGIVDYVDLPRLTISELVDRLGEAERQCKLWQPQVNPHAAAKAAILQELEARHADLAAEKQQIHVGKSYQLEVTPREIRRPVTVAVKQMAWKAFEKLKREKRLTQEPMEFFGITLEVLGKQLGKDFLKANVAEERTGPRAYKITALQPAGALARPAKARKAA